MRQSEIPTYRLSEVRDGRQDPEDPVLKTATVTGVKLTTPADRIGLGARRIERLSDGQPVPGANSIAP